MKRSIHRRTLFASGLAAAALASPWRTVLPALDGRGYPVSGYGPLQPDPANLLELPRGFSYRVISRVGDAMNDGLRVPGLADGMHAFSRKDGMTVLVRNHELNVGDRQHAFAGLDHVPPEVRRMMYDPAVGAGGVTNLVIEPDSGRVAHEFLSLAGTLRNCAGGPTPWGSWLSCEESVLRAGQARARRSHGYAFEVASDTDRLRSAWPLSAMGRFHREAVAVDPRTGIVYQTEDRKDGLFYRFVPSVPGDLGAGGRLEALAVNGMEGSSTGNRRERRVPLRKLLAVRWVALQDPESPGDDLRVQGREAGATTFVRGEGMAVDTAGGSVCVWFKCTSGGPAGLGQLWCYRPAAGEGGGSQRREPGTLELFLEPVTSSLMNQGDNLSLAPGGDLLVCEDNETNQRIRGVTRDGGVYALARNPRGNSEFAGATFSPDARVLYVNLQLPGLTFAIEGPWHARRTAPLS